MSKLGTRIMNSVGCLTGLTTGLWSAAMLGCCHGAVGHSFGAIGMRTQRVLGPDPCAALLEDLSPLKSLQVH